MPLSEKYRHQVALLIETVPFVAAEPDFALKGGTAINLFHRDMPRLSVDMDLTYLPVAPRPESLAAIDKAHSGGHQERIAGRAGDGSRQRP
ncbi:nucleotidyl transferase AbiEii/AbiGii toxin family protein [Bradyrhizobium sp. Cp5.3]|uniref:nucleotidyl transferase AbiEii/AbiGii toxin family protein n=1 Tax=Bradyrhizobium sp. Cp5.3 TaxID=443598 RepID=UPI003526D7F0